MYKNFEEYWEAKKGIFEKLGVSEDIVKMVWSDAADAIGFKLMEAHISGKI